MAFAQAKGMTLTKLKYQIRKAREYAPELRKRGASGSIEFAALPQNVEAVPSGELPEDPLTEPPVLMIQTAAACLQANNQIDPLLLKTALEVMISC